MGNEYKELDVKVYLTEDNLKMAKQITEMKKQKGYNNYKIEDAIRDVLLVGFNDRFTENAKLLIQLENWNKNM